uniref:Fibronectin type-II domain-containing protein n=1 Tax=Canis lupus familiaris TaxID=9615 RepID=A0A8C0PRP6_CANLF
MQSCDPIMLNRTPDPDSFLGNQKDQAFLFSLDGKCFFPFYYRNEVFYDCMKLKTKHKWCSLNETYQGYWKYCSEEDFAKCVFPFWYRHMIYRECTEDGDAFGKKWCSLTQHYNKDKIWKYCD